MSRSIVAFSSSIEIPDTEALRRQTDGRSLETVRRESAERVQAERHGDIGAKQRDDQQ